ncbi:MAG: hypothetical protein A2096_14145 [Spirochaetes bacterium GWF1_41_5]|nr:MAG: hypothetical protein A2096_14145 [Spirochaetes bacterium GWF1_41_5]HBE02840.1 hypothetical protein [Spirochaetia bacterium]
MNKIDFARKSFTAFNGRKFQVTYCRINGNTPGPVLSLVAGQHGMEHIGPNMLKLLITEIKNLDFNGTLYVCPCANPPALELDYEFYPEQEDLSRLDEYYYSVFRHSYCVFGLHRQSEKKNWYNMNRLWNRKESRGIAGEITDWLWNEIILPADVIIDFHSLQAEKPVIFNSDQRSVMLAGLFGIEAVLDTGENSIDDYKNHTLIRQIHTIKPKLGFTVEFSKQHGLKESEYSIGLQGIKNIMKSIGMIGGDIIHERPVYFITNNNACELRAQSNGHIRYFFEQYAPVKTGDVVFEISNLETLEITEKHNAPVNGIMSSRLPGAVAKPGEIVCSLAEAKLLFPAGKCLEKVPVLQKV